jgi:segregation and condensation protein B
MESALNLPLKKILEVALLTAPEPLSLDQMQRLFTERIERSTLRMLLDELRQDWEANNPKTLTLVEVASGWRFQSADFYTPYLSRLNPEKPHRYSRATLEILAIIAYRQPVTRGDIEALRGVAVNPNAMRQLIERSWIDVVGQRDVPGRPSLYATTKTFLDDLNLKSLADLPSMESFIEELPGSLEQTQPALSSLNQDQGDLATNDIDSPENLSP